MMVETDTRTETSCYPEKRRWTREEFVQIGEKGIFLPEEHLELVEGEIVQHMTPQNSPHMTAIRLTEEALRLAFPSRHDVRTQGPLALGLQSQLEPDVAVVSGSIRDYANAHPTTAVLVVEISDSTLAYDRGTKASLYAQAGIAEYWIVNLVDRVLEVHRQPAPMAARPFGYSYLSVTPLTEIDIVTPEAAPNYRILVSDLLP